MIKGKQNHKEAGRNFTSGFAARKNRGSARFSVRFATKNNLLVNTASYSGSQCVIVSSQLYHSLVS